MNAPADRSAELAEAVRESQSKRRPLRILGGNTKAFYGRETNGDPLPVAGNCGIISYEPTELVITARGGTLLSEIQSVLESQGQMLPFEPPHFGSQATFGGAVACGLSGPRRPYTGAVRDFILGVKLLNGKGEILTFGGQVMKNVAGYDVSRLMAGSLGTLGILLEISVKVLPQPQAELTLGFEQDETSSIERMNALARRPLPLSGVCQHEGMLCVRLSGTQAGVASARKQLGGSVVRRPQIWEDIREHRHSFFQEDEELWRLSVPPGTAPVDLPGLWMLDWGGAQRWLRTDADRDAIRSAADAVGGHATHFRGSSRRGEVFHPLPTELMIIHRRIKAAFDPAGILNRGRMYAEI